MRRIILMLALGLLLGTAGVALAQSSTSYRLARWAIAGGGGRSSSASYRVEGTIGQGVAGPPQSESAGFRVRSGFWHGIRTAPAEATPTAPAEATPTAPAEATPTAPAEATPTAPVPEEWALYLPVTMR